MSKIFVYPKFSDLGLFGVRMGGAGLGNLLFSFSRALIMAKENGYILINPTWATVKLGPILRNEPDKRFYFNLFNRVGVAGIRKFFLLLLLPKINEEQLPAAIANKVVLVSGLKNYFKDIRHQRAYIAEQLYGIINNRNRRIIEQFEGDCIGVHIRLGDFKLLNNVVELDWFIAMIEKIRAFLGREVKVCVFSDGHLHELEAILSLPGTEKVNLGNPLNELVALGKCRVIIASNSTFSAWGAFLGKKPVIWKKRNEELENLFTDQAVFEGIVHENQELPDLLKSNLLNAFPRN